MTQKEQLKKLLIGKRGNEYYSKKLKLPLSKIKLLVKEIRDEELQEEDFEDSVSFEEDIINEKATILLKTKDEIRTLEELIEKCDIDIKKWKIERYIQNYWGNAKHPHWQVKAFLAPYKDEEKFKKKFLDFLETYEPFIFSIPNIINHSTNALFLLNKQDAHLNKLDTRGKNNIDTRFLEVEEKMDIMLQKASLSNTLEKIIYILGSDQFNSEWTQTTTKGTPQQNILTYQDAFKAICDHEIKMITDLVSRGKQVEVIFIAGNHDEYVGWHLLHFLQTVFRLQPNITFDISPNYRKYRRYNQAGMMFNHGDSLKPKDLAYIFPIEFKDEWSACNSFYLFTGDKHHEEVKDYHGIRAYQLPALSKAASNWDEKNGFLPIGEMTSFVISEKGPITEIYKELL